MADMTFNETDHPRGGAQNAGNFTEKAHTAPEAKLSQPDRTREKRVGDYNLLPADEADLPNVYVDIHDEGFPQTQVYFEGGQLVTFWDDPETSEPRNDIDAFQKDNTWPHDPDYTEKLVTYGANEHVITHRLLADQAIAKLNKRIDAITAGMAEQIRERDVAIIEVFAQVIHRLYPNAKRAYIRASPGDALELRLLKDKDGETIWWDVNDLDHDLDWTARGVLQNLSSPTALIEMAADPKHPGWLVHEL